MNRILLPTLTVLCCCLSVAPIAAEDTVCPRMPKPPVIDGQLADWSGRPSLTMSEPAVDDLRVESAQLGWDADNLYLAVRVKDKALVNSNALGPLLVKADCLDLRLVTGSGEFIRFIVAPTSAAGTPGMHLTRAPGMKQPSTVVASGTDGKDPSGVIWAVASDAAGWTVEASLPKTTLNLDLAVGSSYPFVVVVWDRDATDRDEWQVWSKRSESSNQKKMPDTWARLRLAD